jgi:predicted dehydrogenase
MSSEQKNISSSRRTFIKNLGFAGAAFTIVPRHVLGNGFTAPSDTLYLGGIGVGGKGASDLTESAKSPNVKVVALCDVDDRRAQNSINRFKDAKYYRDYREMLETEKGLDAVTISSPDHMHAIQSLAAMEMGKHVYVQKPLTHDIYEARQMTEAAHKYKVVTQMGNQGASGDGVRQMQEWYQAGLIGEATEVWCWTDRPVWPQGIPWPTEKKMEVPTELDWDLWLGTAPKKDYVGNLVPFNWRGWWDYGTGALGDMACHIIEPAFKTLQLGYPTSVECSVGSVYVGEFQRGYFPESCPPSSHIKLEFPERNGKPAVKLHWMDGGIQPSRPEELGPNELMGDGGNGVIIRGSKGIMMCGTYGANPRLLPSNLNEQTKNVKVTIDRVPEGHYVQWVNASMAGYKKNECSSDFDYAGPLTESILMGNLALRSFDIRNKNGKNWDYPGRYIKLLWDGPNMKVTNFDEANQFVKREYRTGW